MSQRSTVDRLPQEAKDKLRIMYEWGLTLDEIHEDLCGYLAQLDGAWRPPSRSALGRHRKDYEATAARMREAREMAGALATDLGELADDKTGRLLVDLMRTITFRMLQTGVETDREVDPKDLHFLARTLKDIASASDIGSRMEERIRKNAKEEAADAVATEARKRGLDAETVAAFARAAKGVE